MKFSVICFLALSLTVSADDSALQENEIAQNPQNVDIWLNDLFNDAVPTEKKKTPLRSRDASKNAKKVTNPNKIKSKQKTSVPQATTQMSFPQAYWLFPDTTHQSLAAVEYLCWTVSEPGLYFASTKTNPALGLSETPATPPTGDDTPVVYQMGQIHNAHFGWNSGFRVQGGHQFKNSPWYLLADYTYYRSSHQTNVPRPSSTYGYITGMGTLQDTQTLADKASSYTKLSYDHVQALFGTAWNPLSALKITVSMGSAATWISQFWKVTFNPNPTPFIQDAVTYTGNYSKSSKKDKAWGLGLVAGIGGDAHLGSGMSLGINTSLSALIGQVENRSRGILTPLNSISLISTPTALFNIYQAPEYRVMGQIMLNAKLGWSRTYANFAPRVELGYEFNALINMLDVYREGSSGTGFETGKSPDFSSKPIYLHGPSLKVSFGF